MILQIFNNLISLLKINVFTLFNNVQLFNVNCKHMYVYIINRKTSECFQDKEESERVGNYCDHGMDFTENKEPITSMYEEEFTAMTHLYHCQVATTKHTVFLELSFVDIMISFHLSSFPLFK